MTCTILKNSSNKIFKATLHIRENLFTIYCDKIVKTVCKFYFKWYWFWNVRENFFEVRRRKNKVSNLSSVDQDCRLRRMQQGEEDSISPPRDNPSSNTLQWQPLSAKREERGIKQTWHWWWEEESCWGGALGLLLVSKMTSSERSFEYIYNNTKV